MESRRLARATREDHADPVPPSRPARTRSRPDLTAATTRSALTNGRMLPHDVDHRTAWVRRFRDLLFAHQDDLGGEDSLSEGQRSIVRRAAMLEVQLEAMEARFADNDGVASPQQIEVYQRATNTLRRTLESLGLHAGRKPRFANGGGYNDATREIVAAIEARAAHA